MADVVLEALHLVVVDDCAVYLFLFCFLLCVCVPSDYPRVLVYLGADWAEPHEQTKQPSVVRFEKPG